MAGAFTADIPPSYAYFKNGYLELYNKRQFQKTKMVSKGLSYDPNKTEYENMLANKYSRIWDAGKRLFIWES